MATADPTGLFASAVPYYARYRPGYPPELVEYLAARLGLTERHRVLDVGCGTGQLAIPLARHAGEVLAIDPLAQMLRHGAAAAGRAGAGNVRWVRADSSRIAEVARAAGLDGLQAATFAASFHWTDREAVLADLDRLLDPAGAVVVIADGLAERDQPGWVHAIAEVRARYLGPLRLPGSGARPHLDVLRGSPFAAVERVRWSWHRELTVEQVVGLQFSYSFSTPALLGERARAFADDVRDAVLRRHPSGTVVEPLLADVLVATRPHAGSTLVTR